MIGIVASRLIETHYKPTVVFKVQGFLTASARSVFGGVYLYAALSECQNMIQFGGHKYAAGLTIRPEQYDGFCKCFEQVVSRQIQPDQQERTLRIDMEIPIEEITPKFYRIPQSDGAIWSEICDRYCCQGLLIEDMPSELVLTGHILSVRLWPGLNRLMPLVLAWGCLRNRAVFGL
ncbi:MAG: hypothetical protein CM15mP83_0230 [Flavobacteriaceae bacterium]|nr:MAG: hypothetical protein CM15mP83_0230 [Flavobacteriaceae bacterium]